MRERTDRPTRTTSRRAPGWLDKPGARRSVIVCLDSEGPFIDVARDQRRMCPLVRHPVDDVVHPELIRAAGHVDRKSLVGGPLPVLSDVAVVVREREHPIVRIVVDEQRAVVGLDVDGWMRYFQFL